MIASLGACQLGTCGWCRAGKHERCPTDTTGPSRHPETYLVNHRGLVVDGLAVWLADRVCQYRCPCPSSHDAQLDLFGGAA